MQRKRDDQLFTPCPQSYQSHPAHEWYAWKPRIGDGPTLLCSGEVDQAMLDEAVAAISRRTM